MRCSFLYFVSCVMIDHYVAFSSVRHCRGVTESNFEEAVEFDPIKHHNFFCPWVNGNVATAGVSNNDGCLIFINGDVLMNLGTAFGAVLDPIADKLMVAATLVLLCTRPPEDAMFGQLTWLLTEDKLMAVLQTLVLQGLSNTIPRKLIVNNHNMSTDTNTPFFAFPNQPRWTSADIQEYARATIPLRWSHVQMMDKNDGENEGGGGNINEEGASGNE
ncbi:hypothetical protein Tco_1130166 [Tanacetum coccineum]